jgi:hypothetical protein
MKCAISLVLLAFLVVNFGCADRDQQEELVARADLADKEVLERLSKTLFSSQTKAEVSALEGGKFALEVTLHPDKDSKVKTLDGSQGAAAEVDQMSTVGMSVIAGRRMIRYGRRRNLAKLVVHIQETVKDEAGKDRIIDVFGYTVLESQFDKHTAASTNDALAPQKRGKYLEETTTVDYDHFDEITYRPTITQ